MKCNLCGGGAAIHEVEAPAIRLCDGCRDKLRTHIAVVCAGCDICYWLPKSPHNALWAAQGMGVAPKHIMENAVLMSIRTCRRCYNAVKSFGVAVEAPFLH